MEPHFGKTDIGMFYDYLKKAKNYFEFGSGGSTYQAIKHNNIERVYSVESDITWYNKVNNAINNHKLCFFLVDLKCKPNNWGHPGINCSKEDKIRYSDSLLNLNKETLETIDLILIDGRFRVACCLKSFSFISDNCFIIFDDFLNRKEYHIVLNYFTIVSLTKDKRMVILKKKKCQPPNDDIIKKYELIYN